MRDKLCLMVCQNLAGEVAAIAELEGWPDAQFAIYPAECSRPRSGWNGLVEMVRAHEHECSRVHILGGCCIAGPASPVADLPHCHVHSIDVCFEMLCSKSLLAHWIEQGGHLLTPGWLARWQHHLDEWGFDQETARQFFGESCTRLVLLDTGVDARSAEHLDAFASFVDRPSTVVPIGLKFLQIYLMQLVLGWRSEIRDAQLTEYTTKTNRRISDYAMVLDLVASLTRATTETAVIDKILELFVMICAPASLVYIPFTDGKPGNARSCLPSFTVDDRLLQGQVNLAKGYAWTDSGDGFLLQIMYLDEIVGILALDGIAFPEYKDHYLNLALNIVDVCGLAIANARKYEAVRQAENSLRQQTVELQMRNKELDAFAHTVAHDLKDPLSSVVGFSEFLEDDHAKMPAEQLEEVLHVIARSGRKMTNIVDELLLLASMRKADVEMEPLDMESITGEARDRLADMIQEYGATIVLPETWPVAWGHGPWVEEVWANYLSNAIKYGGRPPHIVLGGEEQTDGKVCFWIHDNGAGLTPGEQASLFVPFTQLDQASTQGHGLGLSIVRRIVEKLGGQVGVQSEGVPGRGSSFYFTLPRPAG